MRFGISRIALRVAELMAVIHDLVFCHEVVVEPPGADFLVDGNLQRVREDHPYEARRNARVPSDRNKGRYGRPHCKTAFGEHKLPVRRDRASSLDDFATSCYYL
jgi:hypothetical protein